MSARLVFVSVVPSPYQRDVFTALAQRIGSRLQVHYLERAAPDSPWPTIDLQPWENVLPGVTFGRGRWRSHVNWNLPAPRTNEFWVVNGAMTDVTTQWIMRRLAGRVPWCFWGELPSTPQTKLRRWVQSRQYAPLQTASAIVAVGERARDAYRHLAPGVPVFNQPYACRLDDFAAAAATRVNNAEPVFLFCGQMIARKGIDVLLLAFEQLVARGTRARLELIGREAELPTLLLSLRASTREPIVYHGFKAPADLPAYFARADVFVLPSRHDGWGVVINQAIGAGLPIICSSAVGAAHDLVEHGVNGFIVPPDDVNALAEAMRQLGENPDLRQQFARATAAQRPYLRPDHAAEFWDNLGDELSFRSEATLH